MGNTLWNVIDAPSEREYDDIVTGWPGDRGLRKRRSRKVRTPQSTVPGNTRGGVTCRIGPQKQTAGCWVGWIVDRISIRNLGVRPAVWQG